MTERTTKAGPWIVLRRDERQRAAGYLGAAISPDPWTAKREAAWLDEDAAHDAAERWTDWARTHGRPFSFEALPLFDHDEREG